MKSTRPACQLRIYEKKKKNTELDLCDIIWMGSYATQNTKHRVSHQARVTELERGRESETYIEKECKRAVVLNINIVKIVNTKYPNHIRSMVLWVILVSCLLNFTHHIACWALTCLILNLTSSETPNKKKGEEKYSRVQPGQFLDTQPSTYSTTNMYIYIFVYGTTLYLHTSNIKKNRKWFL